MLLQDIKQGKARIQYDYYTSKITIIEGQQIVDLSIRIRLKENKTKFVYYTKTENLEIEKYMKQE